MFEKTKQFCDSMLNFGTPGFDLCIYQGGKPLLRYMNGYSDLENKIPMNGKERYNIYSCSKVITCAAALQLWEKGLFSLEDPLCRYLPEFTEMTVQTESGPRPAQKPILIQHLFEMTAGFSYNARNTPWLLKCKEETLGRCPTRETMKYLAKEPLLFEPGDRWEYSLCHDVLAALIEVVAGEKFEDYVQRNIFTPLGMKDSTFMLPEEELPTISGQYKYIDGIRRNFGPTISSFKFGSEYASGGAGGISTVDDYMKFLEGLRTGKVLQPATLKLMTTDRLTDHQKRTYTKNDYGYGLGVRCPKEGGLYTDFGWGGAAGAFLAVDPQEEISVYFATHVMASPGQGLRSLLYRFIMADLRGTESFEALNKELKSLFDYTLTY